MDKLKFRKILYGDKKTIKLANLLILRSSNFCIASVIACLKPRNTNSVSDKYIQQRHTHAKLSSILFNIGYT